MRRNLLLMLLLLPERAQILALYLEMVENNLL
jgi:hypothetical protein